MWLVKTLLRWLQCVQCRVCWVNEQDFISSVYYVYVRMTDTLITSKRSTSDNEMRFCLFGNLSSFCPSYFTFILLGDHIYCSFCWKILNCISNRKESLSYVQYLIIIWLFDSQQSKLCSVQINKNVYLNFGYLNFNRRS